MSYTVFDDRYPPKNRKENGLDILDIQLVDAKKICKLDPNTAAMVGYSKELPVSEPSFPSFLSGKPGYLYRASEGIEIALTEDELLRFLRHDLRSDEAIKLRAHFGIMHEIHDDFYFFTETTAEALQSMENDEGERPSDPN